MLDAVRGTREDGTHCAPCAKEEKGKETNGWKGRETKGERNEGEEGWGG